MLMKNQSNNEEEYKEVSCCNTCYKVLEFFTSRHFALVFLSEQTVEELRKLRLKLINQWTKENMVYLLKIYKKAKKSLGAISYFEKIKQKAHKKSIIERSKTPESVTERKTRNFKDSFKLQFT